jgi:3-oxoacyl-[acyl-carrier protein] reductase
MNRPIGAVALITGGTRGIGLGIARSLAAEGWRLALGGLRALEEVGQVAEVGEVIRAFEAEGVEVCYCRGDVADAEDRSRIVEEVRQRFGALHLLVNNAGITSPGRRDILDADQQDFDRVLDVNLKGPFFLTQLCARWMIQQHEADSGFQGTIVNISSVSGDVVSIHRGDYCLSKSATRMATRLWAVRMAPHAVSVYEVQPGIIHSDMTDGVTEKYDRLIADGLTVEPRWGEPEDVGRAVAMLARGDLSYATGQVLTIDGGLLIRRL